MVIIFVYILAVIFDLHSIFQTLVTGIIINVIIELIIVSITSTLVPTVNFLV